MHRTRRLFQPCRWPDQLFWSAAAGRVEVDDQPWRGSDSSAADGDRIVARVSGWYRSGAYFAINYQPVDYQQGYATGDASIGYYPASDKWSLELICTNFTNVAAFNYVFTQNVTSVTLVDPRLIQGRTSWSF